jgi:hypothetical protein
VRLLSFDTADPSVCFGIACDDDDRLWIVAPKHLRLYRNNGSHLFSVFPMRRGPRAKAPGIMEGGSVTWSRTRQEMFFIPHWGQGSVRVFDCNGKLLREIHVCELNDHTAAIPVRIVDVRALATGQDGTLFVLQYLSPKVLEVNATTGRVIRQWGSFGRRDGQFIEPAAIAVSRVNEVYVVDSSRGCVQVFNCNGSFLRKFDCVNKPGPRCLNSLAFDYAGNILVCDSAKCCVQTFSLTGTHARHECNVCRCTFIVMLMVTFAY